MIRQCDGCKTDQEHYARGYCYPCYRKWYEATPERKAEKARRSREWRKKQKRAKKHK